MAVDAPLSLPLLQQAAVNQRSPAKAKLDLFRSLLHGREDIYPRRFESRKTGRVGYSAGVADIKSDVGATRERLLPFALDGHTVLRGSDLPGAYHTWVVASNG